jgi:hypothetical protein
MRSSVSERHGRRGLWAALALVLAVTLSFASFARADVTGPTGEDVGPTAAVAKAKKKKSSSGKQPAFKLIADGASRYHGRSYLLPREKVVIRGTVKADLEGQDIVVVIEKHGKVVKKLTLRAESAKNDRAEIHARWRPGKRGKYTVKVDLSGAQKAIANEGATQKISIVRSGIHQGSRGVSVRVFQSKLAKLAYVVPRNGRFDAATGRAFMAFRKVNSMARNYTAGSGVSRKLAAGAGHSFKLRYPGAGRHVEVSIRKQVMAFASGGKVVRIYHVSTGAPATPTIRGTYRVYRKDWGTNAKGMVNSNYFIRGYAIHGYADVPPYNASHGCVRVPIPSAASIYAWVRYGTRVDTYY